jgi:hypothetical protein
MDVEINFVNEGNSTASDKKAMVGKKNWKMITKRLQTKKFAVETLKFAMVKQNSIILCKIKLAAMNN